MKVEKITQLFTINLVIYISVLSPVLAQTSNANSSRNYNSKSPIFPYLIENPNAGNSLIRIRCLSTQRQLTRETQRRIIRDTLLRPETQNTVTIEIEGNCHHIAVPEYQQFDDFAPDDYWLTRPGSGWDWKLRR
ncbi:hypothetical protein [Calothrix sp. PCC 6303]|uniref:hypothetical protein n=1 Tax=Calothrix sp. PCC 6303 TaxID=1170562 RepID=UPI0002A054F7|nr:hypothetical protein [Calothrix sp. PCC 6303]AFZ03234.1 hypothetical protein Cal6303_4327 [Calothrix sp. PCC 6303]